MEASTRVEQILPFGFYDDRFDLWRKRNITLEITYYTANFENSDKSPVKKLNSPPDVVFTIHDFRFRCLGCDSGNLGDKPLDFETSNRIECPLCGLIHYAVDFSTRLNYDSRTSYEIKVRLNGIIGNIEPQKSIVIVNSETTKSTFSLTEWLER